MSEHWVVYLIGKPYSDGGQGPDEFNCWGLTRWVFHHHRGITMPLVRIGLDKEDQEAEIRRAARAQNFRPTDDPKPQDWDILLMWGPQGRHVAVCVYVNDGIFVLHALEGVGVVLTPFNELPWMMFKDIKCWRPA